MRKFYFCLILVVSFSPISLFAQEKIKIAVRQDFSLSNLYVEKLKEAYRRAGQPVEFTYLPGGSSLNYSNTGELGINGEAGRLSGVLKKFTNLRKISVPIHFSELTIFTNRKDLNISDWKDLKGYEVTTRIGYKVVNTRLKGMNLKVVQNTKAALMLIEKNRADIAILSKDDGLVAIEKFDLKNIHIVEKPIEVLPVYHMLHKRHEVLIAKLEASLREMEKELVLTTGIGKPLGSSEEDIGFVELILVEAFKRAGVKLRIKSVPSKLSLLNANRGLDDGVAFRIKGIDKTYKNLIRIPEIVLCSEFSGYSKRKLDSISSWENLSKYNVSYVNGWRIFENNVIHGGNVRKADKAEMLFKMLKNDRTDMVLHEKWQGISIANKIGLDNAFINKLPLNQKKMYSYLNIKHADLIQKVAHSLKKMKSDGTYQRMFNQVLARYVNKKHTENNSYYTHVLAGCQ